MKQPHHSRAWESLLWLTLTTSSLACNSGTPATAAITAKAGDPCQDCEQCCPLFAASCCICDRCSQFAFDPATNELLGCNTATLKWEVNSECPGGGYAHCENGAGQRISCIGADGGQVQ